MDDYSSIENPDPIIYPAPQLTAFNTLRSGDTVTGVTGALSYAFGYYRLQPTQTPNFVADNARTITPHTVDGQLKVTNFNVLNYFNGDGQGGGFPTARGATTLEEFTRQRDKIIAAMSAMEADIIGLMEIENDGYGVNSAIADLVNGLNALAPSGTSYAFINPSDS
jgi:predicted extracellular nuclease